MQLQGTGQATKTDEFSENCQRGGGHFQSKPIGPGAGEISRQDQVQEERGRQDQVQAGLGASRTRCRRNK